MAENIEIKVTDNVPGTVSAKFREIAAEARAAHGAIQNLQTALKGISGTGSLQRLQSEVSKNALQQQRLATEMQRTQIAAQRLATEQQRTAAAQDRAAAAAQRLQQQQAKAASAADRFAREGEALRRSLYPLYEAQQLHNESVQRALTLYKQGAISVKTYTDAVNRSADRLQAANVANNALSSGLVKTGKGSQLAAHHLTNLGFQIQDIGVSLASGQNPLTVFIQQGAQIQGIASQAGVGLGRLAAAAAGMLLPLLPLVAAIGAVVGGLKLFTNELNNKAGLDEYAASLGLTAKEMKKLEDASVTMGDTLGGIFDTLMQDTGAGEFFDGLADSALKAFKNILGYAQTAVLSIVALFKSGNAVVSELWARLPVGIKGPIVEALNFTMTIFEKWVNVYVKGINLVIEGLNKISSIKIEPFKEINLNKFSTDFAEASGRDLGEIALTTYVDSLKTLESKASAFWDRAGENAIKRAKDRIKTQADAIIADRTPGAGGKSPQVTELEKLEKQLARVRGEVSPTDEAVRKLAQAQDILNRSVAAGLTTQAEADRVMTRLTKKYQDQLDPIGAVNRELKQELDLLNMLPEARQTEQRMLQIENEFRQKNIDLTKEQTDAIRDQLQAIQDRTRVSQAEQQLLRYSEGRKDFSAGIQASVNLRKNPNSGYTAGDQARDSASMLGGMGVGTDNTSVGLQAQQAQYQEYYDNLRQMRDADLIGEQDYWAAKTQLFTNQYAGQFQTASTFLGDLSALQKSENKKQAEIGKKAAIAQALVSTYMSATQAFAAMSGIPYVGPVLGAVAAAAAIAAGMANVNAIRSQNAGFMAGGYTGGMSATEERGVVHGKEYVMDAATTSRLGVANLDALRSGAASVQKNGERYMAQRTAQNTVADEANRTSKEDRRGNYTINQVFNLPSDGTTKTASQIALESSKRQRRAVGRLG